MRRIMYVLLPLLLVGFSFNSVDTITVSGQIKDEKGDPVAFASIVEKGTKNGTKADGNGYFTIKINEGSGLVITAAGFKAVIITPKGGVQNITLVTDETAEQEVVVTSAYGVKKSARTTPFSSQVISPQNLFLTQQPSISNSLSGRAAGIAINNPGNGNLKIRGGLPSNYQNGYFDFKQQDFNTESYDNITENRFLKVKDNPLSTFSIDVDAASYSNMRRFLNLGQLPPAGAVRIEEMINYFHYEYPQPADQHPFSINTEISDCPWNKDNKLVLIGLQGKKIPTESLPASNLVFLIDVSGSMYDANKLPLVKASMKMLVDQLREKDKVAMVVYAGNAGLVLPSTSGSEKQTLKDAIDKLEAGGSTAGGEGIKLAYKIAKQNFAKGGNNRVILCTDGDFNIGVSSDDDMERLIEDERKSGVFLTVLGFGMGNYKDSKMQKLADKGNGNHAYIDQLSEAKKVLVSEFGGTLFTIAKDVKLQIEFNPAKVQGYRLIGYENRILNKEDFNNDKKDAGELGSGHTVTALYEVIPTGVKSSFLEKVDSLKYQSNYVPLSKSSHSDEIMTVKFRYKAPDEDVSKLIEHPVTDQQISIVKTTDNFRFAAAVAEFGMLLRNSEFKSASSFVDVLSLAKKAKGADEEGYRSEFVRLVESAQLVAREKDKGDGDKVVRGN